MTTLEPDPYRSEAGGLPRVARSESELITMTRTLLVPSKRYLPLLRTRPRTRVETIGPTAMGLLQQTLTHGVTLELLRRGGWQTRRFLQGEQPKRGRLWQRHAELPALDFGPASFELLCWLHAEDVVSPQRKLSWRPGASLGDELLHYFAAEHIVRAGGSLHQDAFLRSPLCQLGHADALSGPEPLPLLDYRDLARGPGAFVLEALTPDLTTRWLEMEAAKGEIVSLARMREIGHAQAQALASLFAALDRVEPRRRDLATFLADAGAKLLARGPERRCPDHRWWTHDLDLRAPLSERQAAFVAAAATLRGIVQLGRWLDEAGVVAHFDEGYDAAQLLLSSWSFLRAAPDPKARPGLATAEEPQMPAAILDRANILAHQLESLHSLGSPS